MKRIGRIPRLIRCRKCKAVYVGHRNFCPVCEERKSNKSLPEEIKNEEAKRRQLAEENREWREKWEELWETARRQSNDLKERGETIAELERQLKKEKLEYAETLRPFAMVGARYSQIVSESDDPTVLRAYRGDAPIYMMRNPQGADIQITMGDIRRAFQQFLRVRGMPEPESANGGKTVKALNTGRHPE